MAQGVWTKVDSQIRWAGRDLRNPFNWPPAARTRRVEAVIVSPRWSNPSFVDGASLDNPYGVGPAIPGARNFVDVGAFFTTYKTNPNGTYDANHAFNNHDHGGSPTNWPPFNTLDGCADPLADDHLAADEYGAWARTCRDLGMTNFSATLSSGAGQGWMHPYVRLDEVTQNVSGTQKVQLPFWLVDARHASFPQTFADFVTQRYSWAAGLNWEYWAVASWYKNWRESAYWTSLSSGAKSTFTNEWEAGIHSALALVRAARPDWQVVGQQVPFDPNTKPAMNRLNGAMREGAPDQFIGGGNSARLADDLEHRAAVFAFDPALEYVSIWQVVSPGAYQDSVIEAWKAEIAAPAAAYMAIGDAGAMWEGPDFPVSSVVILRPTANGNENEFTPSGAATSWQAASDQNGTTFFYSTLLGDVQTFAFAQLPTNVDYVQKVVHVFTAKHNGTTGTFKLGVDWYSGGALILGRKHDLTNSVVEYRVEIGSPDGIVWTPTKVNAVRCGVSNEAVVATKRLEVYEHWLEVTVTTVPAAGKLHRSRKPQRMLGSLLTTQAG